MPLSMLGDIWTDFNAVVTSVTSSMLDYGQLNQKLADTVSSMTRTRPVILAIAQNINNDANTRNNAVGVFNALWDETRKNIIDLSVWTQRQYSGPNLPPRIKGDAMQGFSGLEALPAIPIATAGVIAVGAVAVTTVVVYGAKIILMYQKTAQLEEWGKLTPEGQRRYNEGPGSGTDMWTNLAKIIPWVVVGGIALYAFPLVKGLFPKSKQV